jgi:multiple sugar transport system ATP-binding protein
MLKLNAVTKRFGRTTAIQNLTLECQDNEFVVIFGPAGAGKSTTLRMIAGIIKPTQGEIHLHGHSLANVPPENRNMSMVFENYALYSHLSVFDNLAFPLRARKVASNEITQRVEAMAEVLQITPFLQRRPGFLSGAAAASRWGVPSFERLTYTSWMNPFLTWTPNCATGCAAN